MIKNEIKGGSESPDCSSFTFPPSSFFLASPMGNSLHHRDEDTSNGFRDLLACYESHALRTYTPTQAVLARSAGVFHWTPEGRRLFDFTSGVLVANLGHNPRSWLNRFHGYLEWRGLSAAPANGPYVQALPLTTYNALTPVEMEASRRLAELLQGRPGGQRLHQVLWAASGSEAVQKALWAALARERTRDLIIATRHGFHGKKGLAGAVTGCETDKERDPRVHFIGFPQTECIDIDSRRQSFDATGYAQELEALYDQFGKRLGVLITEPYLGGAGSYHPPREYLQLLQQFCRRHDALFILDEVQSNFGRTGRLFAFETYGLEPDIVVLGKGLANGVPVAAAVGRRDIFASLDFGEGSDTWSGNPLCCAGVLATLDEFAQQDILTSCQSASAVLEAGLARLRELPFVANIRGEEGGMVWGVEMRDYGSKTAAEWANAAVLACYRGEGKQGIHLLGPLAKKVLRIAPPLIITEAEATESVALMYRILARLLDPSHE
jgi:4-aminobutyrate aminotransferase / (S)-3-amino-2-methylpropionate transaminase / 5-aminovalerate transaminase